MIILKYIGPFLRMNNLSKENIYGELFHLSKESIKTLYLNSKCGIVFPFRSSKKSHTSTNDINISKDFSPLVCIYKKSSPLFIHNKLSYGFDTSSFKREISPTANALFTMSLLELIEYYSLFQDKSENISNLNALYKILCKKQLEFYNTNLRNSEGFFIDKKNSITDSSKDYNLVDDSKKIKIQDQAYMMIAYYSYGISNIDDPLKSEYKSFSLQILDMLLSYKDYIYSLSLTECCMILTALNIFFEISYNESCRELIMDLSDYIINIYEKLNKSEDNIEISCMLCFALNNSYSNTQIINFKDKSLNILAYLKDIYDDNKKLFLKPSSKKEIKYSSTELCLYLLITLLDTDDNKSLYDLYKTTIINSGIITSWPDAPTLDDIERYKNLSLLSDDMIDEGYFRADNFPSFHDTGLASIFLKNIIYSRKKDTFYSSKNTFDSGKNAFIFYLFIHYLKSSVVTYMNFPKLTLTKI